MGRQAELLEEEFPESVIKVLPKAGRKLSYVPVAEVITRLNRVLGVGGWSYHTVNLSRDSENPSWVIAEVEIQASVDDETTMRTGVGGYDTASRGMDVADGYKSAVSEALKKAAQSLGVGLHLSRTEEAIAMDAMADLADGVEVNALVEDIKSQDDKALQDAVKKFAASNGIGWSSMSATELTRMRSFVEDWISVGDSDAAAQQEMTGIADANN